MNDIFIGRQPIYDRNLNVAAYELLYRDSFENRANITDADLASAQMIFTAIMDFGLDRLVGAHHAFVNLTRAVLLSEKLTALPKDKVVLEVLETIDPDGPVVEAVTGLAEAGFQMALDDFFYDVSWEPLVQRAHIIKVDVLGMTPDDIRGQVTALKDFRGLLLAEKVEDQDCFQLCRELGFHYFQGHFFCRPKVIAGKRVPANRLAVVQLLAALNDPDITVGALERLISQDVGLSYRLLRYINSAFFGLSRRIESIHHALVLLGLKSVKRWATLISMSEVSDKPHELMVTAMVRAKMCELLAEAKRFPNADVFFTVGLFSVLDALMDSPMAEILDALPITDELRDALLAHAGAQGATLECVLAYEYGNWDKVIEIGLEPSVIRAAYLGAIAWVGDVESALRGDGAAED
ncbi:MAG: HDOD domain-containing protein [Nitrospirae bacterium]|nr:HDOD domain-containing protein [Nitrospirota bacterium]